MEQILELSDNILEYCSRKLKRSDVCGFKEIANRFIVRLLPEMMYDYAEQDIFNADEVSISLETFSVILKHNDRIGVLVGSNMNGTEKILVVGYSCTPKVHPKIRA